MAEKKGRRQVEAAERERRVIELRARGLSFHQISQAGIDGVSSANSAHRIFHRGIGKMPAMAAETYRRLENEKLDVTERKLMGILSNRDTETKDVLRAAQVLTGVFTRRAALNGLDLRPANVDALNGGISTVYVDTSVIMKSRTDPEDSPTPEEIAGYGITNPR